MNSIKNNNNNIKNNYNTQPLVCAWNRRTPFGMCSCVSTGACQKNLNEPKTRTNIKHQQAQNFQVKWTPQRHKQPNLSPNHFGSAILNVSFAPFFTVMFVISKSKYVGIRSFETIGGILLSAAHRKIQIHNQWFWTFAYTEFHQN